MTVVVVVVDSVATQAHPHPLKVPRFSSGKFPPVAFGVVALGAVVEATRLGDVAFGVVALGAVAEGPDPNAVAFGVVALGAVVEPPGPDGVALGGVIALGAVIKSAYFMAWPSVSSPSEPSSIFRVNGIGLPLSLVPVTRVGWLCRS